MGRVIPFPAPVVHLHVALPKGCAAAGDAAPWAPLLAVEHDGMVYSFATLLARLPDEVLDALDAMVPRSAQEAWDCVVRQWPRIAEAVARSSVPTP